jgi:hypothetical protein
MPRKPAASAHLNQTSNLTAPKKRGPKPGWRNRAAATTTAITHGDLLPEIKGLKNLTTDEFMPRMIELTGQLQRYPEKYRAHVPAMIEALDHHDKNFRRQIVSIRGSLTPYQESEFGRAASA